MTRNGEMWKGGRVKEKVIRFLCAIDLQLVVGSDAVVRRLIQDICNREGITRYRLADALGTSRASVSDWYRGRRIPAKTAQTLLRLVHRYGIKTLFSGELSQPVEPQANDRLKIT